MNWLSLATIVASAESKIAAEQASSAVSMARTSMRRSTPYGRPREGGTHIAEPWSSGHRLRGGTARSDRADLGHVRHEMPQQVLDAVLERRGRGRAAGAGALHRQEYDAVLEAAEGDVAAVIGDRRPHARLDQFLDGLDGLGVGGVEKFAFVGGAGRRSPSLRSGAPDM